MPSENPLHPIRFLLLRQDKPPTTRENLSAAAKALGGISLALALMVGYFSSASAGFMCGIYLFFSLMYLALIAILLVGEPSQQLSRDSAIHSRLLAGRAYQEIVGTGTRIPDIVDSVVVHSLSRIWSMVIVRAPILAGSVLLLYFLNPHIPFSSCMETALCVLIGYFLLLALAGPWFSYFGQWASLLEYRRNQVVHLFQMAGLVAAFLLLTVAYSVSAGLMMPAFLALYALSMAISRHQVISELQHAVGGSQSEPRRSVRAIPVTAPSKNPWILTDSPNPIVFRERSKEARRVPAGLLGMLVVRGPVLLLFALFLLPQLETLSTCGRDAHGLSEYLFFPFLVICAQTTRSAFRPSSAAVLELQQKTLEPFACTRTSPKEFYQGWMELTLGPLMLENVGLSVIFVGLAFVHPLPTMLGMIAMLFSGTWMGAQLGLHSSLASSLSLSQSQLASGLLSTLLGLPLIAFVLAAILNTWFNLPQSFASLSALVSAILICMGLHFRQQFLARMT